MTKFKVGDKVSFKKSNRLDIMENNCNGIVTKLSTSWFGYYSVETTSGQSYLRREEELNHSNYYFQQQEARKLLGLK